MPTYEYQCKACGNKWDLFQKVSDPAPTTCPKCHEGPVQKLFSSVGIIFKGSGFYVTDYKRAEERKSEGAAAASETKTDGDAKTSSTGGEKKSDAPKESASPSEPSKSAA